MPKKSENILHILTTLPWYYSVITAIGVYMGMAFFLPIIGNINPITAGFTKGLVQLAPLAFFLFLLPAPISLIRSQRKRKQLDAQQDINSIRDLSWQRFEELVGEAYRRQGYWVKENDGAGPDGGIDLVISKGGKRYLVQCKQYRVQKVGVKVVREMYGLVAAEHAAGGIVITSGTFTRDAGRFADGKLLELVDGAQLARLIANIQSAPGKTDVSVAPTPAYPQKPNAVSSIPSCPLCDREMVMRTAKKGGNIGKQFWGCSEFPKCQGTRG